MMSGPEARKASFAPIVAPGTRVLILGSLPGERSLAEGRYYAHPQNQFWRLVGDVIGRDLDTLEVLNTGSAERARTLAVNLERRRWLARKPPATRIDVNIAAATLNYIRDGKSRNQRREVVGQPDWETPQLGSPMFRLVANPTWTVP